MADLFQQEPSQQRAPLDAEQAPARPTGTPQLSQSNLNDGTNEASEQSFA